MISQLANDFHTVRQFLTANPRFGKVEIPQPSPHKNLLCRVYTSDNVTIHKDRRVGSRGSFGTVFEATWTVIDQSGPDDQKATKQFPVVVKIMYPKSGSTLLRDPMEEWARELRMWINIDARGGHPNLLPLIGAYHDGPDFGLISPRAERNLNDWIENESNISSYTERHKLICDIVEGLHFLHAQRFPIVHGDLHASNVLLVQDSAILTGFGLSKVANKLSSISHGVSETDLRQFFAWRHVPELRDGSEIVRTLEADIYMFGLLGKAVALGDEVKEVAVRDGYGEMVKLTEECTIVDPQSRPTARQLLDRVKPIKPPPGPDSLSEEYW